MTCAQRIEDHYKKAKTFQRSANFDEASKMYNREFKIRSNEEFESLDFDLINLMAYYNAHPQVSDRSCQGKGRKAQMQFVIVEDDIHGIPVFCK